MGAYIFFDLTAKAAFRGRAQIGWAGWLVGWAGWADKCRRPRAGIFRTLRPRPAWPWDRTQRGQGIAVTGHHGERRQTRQTDHAHKARREHGNTPKRRTAELARSSGLAANAFIPSELPMHPKL